VTPTTRYARSGDVQIAYQTLGDGPLDVVFVPGLLSHLDCYWEDPNSSRFFQRLASFSRVILFDKRGIGLSDRIFEEVPLEQRMDDVRAVMEAVGSDFAAVFGVSEGGPMSLLFAATYPERVTALAVFGSGARFVRGPDYPVGPSREVMEAYFDQVEQDWGMTGSLGAIAAPSLAHDDWAMKYFARVERLSATPGAAISMMKLNLEIDVRHVLPAIGVPTLIVHREKELVAPVEGARYMAERIPGASYVELPGNDHSPFAGDMDTLLDEVQMFFTGVRGVSIPERVLATVLFTDIVGSTQRAAELGDRRWRQLLERHNAVVRCELERFRAREIDTAGDGFLAAFDGPARAVRCAAAIRESLRPLGLEIRAGLHTGECERIGDKLGGIAVHIGARVAASAGPNETRVSSTVRDLVAGSGISFVDCGSQVLRGVPGEWRIFSVP
jgi:pimeloyl-ACP methyl ester carboxylesterase